MTGKALRPMFEAPARARNIGRSLPVARPERCLEAVVGRDGERVISRGVDMERRDHRVLECLRLDEYRMSIPCRGLQRAGCLGLAVMRDHIGEGRRLLVDRVPGATARSVRWISLFDALGRVEVDGSECLAEQR